MVLPERGHLNRECSSSVGQSFTDGRRLRVLHVRNRRDRYGRCLATGETWVRVPETIRIELTGGMRPGVSAKDIMLALCARLGMDGGDIR